MSMVYLVGQNRMGEEMNGSEDTWEVRGIFTDKARAIALCTDDEHFVAPYTLDEDLGPETVQGPGWYPLLETEAEGMARTRS